MNRDSKGQFKKGQPGFSFWLGKKQPPEMIEKRRLKMLGIKNHFFGKKHTEATKFKMRMAKLGIRGNRLGKKASFITIENIRRSQLLSLKNKGKNHYNWKGGITPIHETFRRSQPYKLWRIAVFKRDDYTCQECGQRGGKLQADHIKPFATFLELRLNIANGRTLCKNCHKKTPTWGRPKKIYAI